MITQKNYWFSPITKIKYELKWCKECNCFTIICPEESCFGTSCNGSGCEKCNSDFDFFYKHTKLHLNNYLTKEELIILEKADKIKELISKSSNAGFNEIDFNYCKIYNSKYDEEILLKKFY